MDFYCEAYTLGHFEVSLISGSDTCTLFIHTQTDAEYLEKHRSYSPPDPKLVLKFPVYKAPQNVSYADSLDWRTKGAVGSVKDQVS